MWQRGGTWTSRRVVATDHSRLRVMMMMMISKTTHTLSVRSNVSIHFSFYYHTERVRGYFTPTRNINLFTYLLTCLLEQVFGSSESRMQCTTVLLSSCPQNFLVLFRKCPLEVDPKSLFEVQVGCKGEGRGKCKAP